MRFLSYGVLDLQRVINVYVCILNLLYDSNFSGLATPEWFYLLMFLKGFPLRN